ncbi:MAG: hypothetical protein ACREJ8_09085, partial [Candidatus Methylomirabilales bacterium]
MTRVMLPCTSISLPARLELPLVLLAIDMRVVDIGIAVDVDIDIAAAPVTSSPRITPSYAKGHARREGKRDIARR